MTTQMQKITVDDFCDRYMPKAAFVLIQKDGAAEKTTSGLWLTKNTRDLTVKWAGSGRIRVISPFSGESDHDNYLVDLYRKGDHVTFNASNPIDVPLPPHNAV